MSDPKELGELAAVVIAADHTADISALRTIIAAGWVSPEEAKAREAAARQEALLEAEAKHRAEVERLAAFERHAAELAVSRLERAEEAEATIARVEALTKAMDEVPDYTASDYDRGRVDQRHDNATELWAALAEPERDEESGND